MMRKKVKNQDSKWNSPAMKQMREAAFGTDMTKFIRDTSFKMETGRNDQALIEAAAAKRARKAAKGTGSVRKDIE